MLRYLDYGIYLQEVPNEISLGFTILGCNRHCPNCHSQHTWDTECKSHGQPLTLDAIKEAVEKERYITCILYYGGDWDMESLRDSIHEVKLNLPTYNIALYTGMNYPEIQGDPILKDLTYIKVGSYISRLGGLRSRNTNQRLYKLKNGKVNKNLTSFFWSD